MYEYDQYFTLEKSLLDICKVSYRYEVLGIIQTVRI